MPVSLGVWRVRIGTFVQWPRLKSSTRRLTSLLKEKDRLLKLLSEREKDGCGSSGINHFDTILLLMVILLVPCLFLFVSGDVELNPGPNTRDDTQPPGLSSRTIFDIAEAISGESKIRRLGLNLHLEDSSIDRCVQTNRIGGHVTSDGTYRMLVDWKKRTRIADQDKLLREALMEAGLTDIGNRLLSQEDLSKSAGPSDKFEQCREDLKDFYKMNFLIQTDPLGFDAPVQFDEMYTNLTLHTTRLGKDEAVPLLYDEILTARVAGVVPTRLLVSGEGGVGKTTFCHKMALDWANGKQFQEFDMVIYIPLRDVEAGQTVGDIVANKYIRSPMRSDVLNRYILEHNMFIIFDGYDEFDEDEGSEIVKILKVSPGYKGCRVLLTSRPWKKHNIKQNKDLNKMYAFITIDGFNDDNIKSYIEKFFVNDAKTGSQLINFMSHSEIIQENMAPFPIFTSMLCVLWQGLSHQHRTISETLQTYSQLFDEIISYLKDHYLAKHISELNEEEVLQIRNKIKAALVEIGKFALSGLQKNKLSFREEDVNEGRCSVDLGCQIGVLTKERKILTRYQRAQSKGATTSCSVTFPHLLFQEYLAGMYFASLYENDREEFETLMNGFLYNPERHRYLWYFASACSKDIGLYIVNKIIEKIGYLYKKDELLVDIAFECPYIEVSKTVATKLFAEKKTIMLDSDITAHTFSGHLHLMEMHRMETLRLFSRNCRPSESRDVAEVLMSSKTLKKFGCSNVSLHDEFFKVLSMKTNDFEASSKSLVQDLSIDDSFICHLVKSGGSLQQIFPHLEKLSVTVTKTITETYLDTLSHSKLQELSLTNRGQHVAIIIEPTVIGREFLSCFPKITKLHLTNLVIGNTRMTDILLQLKCLKTVGIIRCYTDTEFNSTMDDIKKRTGMDVKVESESNKMSFDLRSPLTDDLAKALCFGAADVSEVVVYDVAADFSFTLLEEPATEPIKVTSLTLDIHNVELAPDPSRDLARFILCLSASLKVTLNRLNVHENFFSTAASLAGQGKIHILNLDMPTGDGTKLSSEASRDFALFICTLPSLRKLTIKSMNVHEDFYSTMSSMSASAPNTGMPVMCSLHEFTAEDHIIYHFGKSVGTLHFLFPHLRKIKIAVTATITSDDMQKLHHESVQELDLVKTETHLTIAMILPTVESGRIFSKSFPRLKKISFTNLMIGSSRMKSILLHLKYIDAACIRGCYTNVHVDYVPDDLKEHALLDTTVEHGPWEYEEEYFPDY